mmetsp:Transcript_126695/g.253193  ORF Transcript_126695/g.253193 Transcript_126695/m.253193 type:complete len:226 (+) Transcript_126695:60-737(+)
MVSLLDGSVVACSGVTVLLVAAGMWLPAAGGTVPLTKAFGWHPVLMALAFPGFMTTGRWVYMAENLGSKLERRSVHRATMLLAVAAMLMGYICIFLAHWPTRQFFGYDFRNGKWKPLLRVIHVWLGYPAMVLVLSQMVMGLRKAEALKHGRRLFTFHGKLGKAIVLFGALTMVPAICFWPWNVGLQTLLLLCVGTCAFFGGLRTAPQDKKIHNDLRASKSELQMH